MFKLNGKGRQVPSFTVKGYWAFIEDAFSFQEAIEGADGRLLASYTGFDNSVFVEVGHILT